MEIPDNAEINLIEIKTTLRRNRQLQSKTEIGQILWS